MTKLVVGAALVLAATAGALAAISPWLGLAASAVVLVLAALPLIPGAPSAGDPLPTKDSWGGRAVVLLALSVVVTALLSRVLDGTVLRFDNEGHRYLVSAGTTGRSIGALVLLAAVACGVHAIVASRGRFPVHSGYSRWLLALVGWWLLCAVLFRGEVDSFQTAMEAIGVAVLAPAVVASPPTRKTLMSLAHVLNLATVTGLAYGLANPDQQFPCRPDKCGIFNSLFTGYLFQENGAARLVVLLVPAAAAIRSRTYLLLTLALAGVFVAATGSRTSLASYGVAVVAVWWLRRSLFGGKPLRVPAIARVAPLLLFAASVYLLLTAAGRELTGRGEILAGIRERLTGTALFVGSGPDTVSTLRLAYGALAFGEHGEAPHIAVNAGAVGVVFFALALIGLARIRQWTPERAIALALVLVAATQFLTEPAIELQLRTMSFALLLVTIGLFAGPAPVLPGPEVSGPAPPGCVPGRRERHRADVGLTRVPDRRGRSGTDRLPGVAGDS